MNILMAKLFNTLYTWLRISAGINKGEGKL